MIGNPCIPCPGGCGGEAQFAGYPPHPEDDPLRCARCLNRDREQLDRYAVEVVYFTAEQYAEARDRGLVGWPA